MKSIAVVGAGPAGCSAAYHLARSGHRVTLFDKASFPRDKICGDAISPGALAALAAMDIYPAQVEAAAGRAMIDGCVIGAPNGASSVVASSLKCYCVPRLVFDDLLYRKALAQGVTFQRENVRDLEQLSGEFEWVIDARGVYAGTANAIAVRSYWQVPNEALTDQQRYKMQLLFHRFLGAAYGWIFPVDQSEKTTTFNVGVGVWMEDFAAVGGNVGALMTRFVEHDPRARALKALAIETTRPKGCYLAAAKPDARVARNRILKIGDAANLTDPLSGEGIQNAISSGALVTEAINLSTDAGNVARAWQLLYSTRFETHFRAGLQLRSLLHSRFAKNLLVGAMNLDKRVADHFHAVIFDFLQYNELAPSLVRSFFTKPPADESIQRQAPRRIPR